MADPDAAALRSPATIEDVAGALDRVADLLEVQRAGLHRVRAWRHGAASLRESGLSRAEMARRAARGELPGVGPRLASAMAELARTDRPSIALGWPGWSFQSLRSSK